MAVSEVDDVFGRPWWSELSGPKRALLVALFVVLPLSTYRIVADGGALVVIDVLVIAFLWVGAVVGLLLVRIAIADKRLAALSEGA
jgi:hypothetical protein